MNNIVLISLIILLILVILLLNKQENLAGSSFSAEAVANIASVYADPNNTVTMNNLTVTNKLTGNLTGNVTGNLTSPDGKYTLHISNDGMITTSNALGKTNMIIDSELIINGNNVNDNHVRIGLNNGDGAATTKSNLGIFSENKTTNIISKLQVNNFELGRRTADGVVNGMIPNKNYDYIRSNLKNNGVVNMDYSGIINTMWDNNYLYYTFLNNNQRAKDYGFLPSSDFDL